MYKRVTLLSSASIWQFRQTLQPQPLLSATVKSYHQIKETQCLPPTTSDKYSEEEYLEEDYPENEDFEGEYPEGEDWDEFECQDGAENDAYGFPEDTILFSLDYINSRSKE